VHIAYITDQRLPQTATDTEQLVNMAAAFGKAGADVTLCTPSHWFKNDNSASYIADYYSVPETFRLYTLKGAMPSIRGIEKLTHGWIATQIVNDFDDVDIVYTRNLPIVIAFLLLTDKKIIYETYRPWPDQKKAMRFLFKKLKKRNQFLGLVLHSQLAAASYKKIGYDDERLLVAHNGVNVERFTDELSKADARRILDLNQDSVIVTYTGRVNKEKGLSTLLRLAKEFKEVEFLIVGSEGEGAIEREAKGLPNVQVYPWQSVEDVPKFLSASDILFIPPTAAPLKDVGNTVLPMKTFSYMAAGKIILGPNTPDLKEVLTDGENAILVQPDNFSALKKQFGAIVNNVPTNRPLGVQAKKDIENSTWENRAEKIIKFIENHI
jgi:glycosyltransferase involved in cell wall biosynthesis